MSLPTLIMLDDSVFCQCHNDVFPESWRDSAGTWSGSLEVKQGNITLDDHAAEYPFERLKAIITDFISKLQG